jgi:hypothetical protein
MEKNDIDIERNTKTGEKNTTTTTVPTQIRKKKRKRHKSKSSPSSPILNGRVLAISTIGEQESNEGESQAHSYTAVHQLCLKLGATVSPQVHKRVFALVCTPLAVQRCTQRVRKVIQKQKTTVGLIHVQWLYDCQKENACIDWSPYSLNELGKESLVQFEARPCGAIPDSIGEEEPSRISQLAEEVSIALDCCCVCHDTDRDDCIWCTDCNVTTKRKTTNFTAL